MGEDGGAHVASLLRLALETGDASDVAQWLQEGGDGPHVEAIASELYSVVAGGGKSGGSGAASSEAAADVAAVAASLQEDLPPEQFRVLRRALLTAVHNDFEAGRGGARLGICQLLCELFLADCIPETVIYDCLELLLWDIRDPLPTDIACACAILHSVGPALDASELDAADEIMEDFFARLKQLTTSGALPEEQHHAVLGLLRQRASGWAEEAAQEAAPVLALPQRGGEEDWRSVLDAKAAGGGAGAQDRGSSSTAEAQDAEQAAAAAAAATCGEPEQPAAPPQPTPEEQKQESAERLVAAAPAAGHWDVLALLQQVQQQAELDLSVAADARRLVQALLDHAATSAVAAGAGTEPEQPLAAAVAGCASLVAELARRWPAAGVAAAAHLVAAFRRRSEARSKEARQLLGQQMLLAGVLAQHGVLPQQQLEGLLEQLARQVMKPGAADVVCLCALLRGAGVMTETKKGQWWKAVAQLAGSSNVSPEAQRELEHLLVLREHKWDAAAAAHAAAQLAARKAAEAAAAVLEEARLQRQAQEEAAARAAAEVARHEEAVKTAAARLAELEKQQAAAQAAAAAAQTAQRVAEKAAESAAKQRAESDRAATAARKQAAEAEARAAAAAATGAGGGTERGRHWYCWPATAAAGPGDTPFGPYTAAELVAWQYIDSFVGGELQVCRAGEAEYRLLQERMADLESELPSRPGLTSTAPPSPPIPPAGGLRSGRGRGGQAGRFPEPGRGGRGGRSGRGGAAATQFPAEYSPAPGPQQPPAGRGGRGRGGRGELGGRGYPAAARGRGRGDPSIAAQSPYSYQPAPQQPQQAQQAQQASFHAQSPYSYQPVRQQAQQAQRAASPPRFGLEDMLPHVFVQAPPQAAAPATTSSGGYHPLQQQQQQQQQQAAFGADLCPACAARASAHIFIPCGHKGHCTDCMPPEMPDAEKVLNCAFCPTCQKPVQSIQRCYF